MIISRTPLRISFAGGGTDIPSFYKKNSYGSIINCGINKYIYVSVKKHSKIFPEKIRLNYSQTEQVQNINKIKNPIIKACLEYLEIDDNLYISTIADAPGSSGLGSSSSFCVGLLNALYAYMGKLVNRNKLAEDAANIEIEILKRPIGKQDHYAAAFSSINFYKFYANGNISIMPIDENSKNIKLIFSNLYTFYTGISRDASKVLAKQEKKSSINNPNLLKIRDQAEELFDLIKDDKFSIKKFGDFLEIGWELKKKLGDQVSNKFIDDAYIFAKKNGAYGGKLSGAGGGGFLSFVAPKNLKNRLLNSLKKKKLKYFPVQLESSGSIILSKY
jgi:D-glycero-alpha-D-manno-heptose-7-phosphate kinase